MEGKWSKRRPEMMEKAARNRGDDIKAPHVRVREGDDYELFDKAIQNGGIFSYG
jgi:hypothetical protein